MSQAPKPPEDSNDDLLLRQIAKDVADVAQGIERWRAENPEQARIQDVKNSLALAHDLRIAAEEQANENYQPNPRRYRF